MLFCNIFRKYLLKSMKFTHKAPYFLKIGIEPLDTDERCGQIVLAYFYE